MPQRRGHSHEPNPPQRVLIITDGKSAFPAARLVTQFDNLFGPLPIDVIGVKPNDTEIAGDLLGEALEHYRDALIISDVTTGQARFEASADDPPPLRSVWNADHNVVVFGSATGETFTHLLLSRSELFDTRIFPSSLSQQQRIARAAFTQWQIKGGLENHRQPGKSESPWLPTLSKPFGTWKQTGAQIADADLRRVFWITDRPARREADVVRELSRKMGHPVDVIRIDVAQGDTAAAGFIAAELALNAPRPVSIHEPTPTIYVETDQTLDTRALWVGRSSNGVTVVGPPPDNHDVQLSPWRYLRQAGVTVHKARGDEHVAPLDWLVRVRATDTFTAYPQDRATVPSPSGIAYLDGRGGIELVAPAGVDLSRADSVEINGVSFTAVDAAEAALTRADDPKWVVVSPSALGWNNDNGSPTDFAVWRLDSACPNTELAGVAGVRENGGLGVRDNAQIRVLTDRAVLDFTPALASTREIGLVS